MTKHNQKTKIEESRNKVKSRLDVIAKLQKEVPSLKKVEEDLDWMLNAEESAPIIINLHQSENLLYRLSELDILLDRNEISLPNSYIPSFISSTGTSSSSDYIQYVYKARDAFPKDNNVQDWARGVADSYSTLRIKQTRTEMVTSRLNSLDKRLGDLHIKAIQACLSASAGVQSSVEGAAIVRELLDGFKGELIRRCKEGRKATYQRIADNLAFEALKQMIVDQQDMHESLHNELSGIIKSRVTTSQSRIQELLSLAEDLVFAITIALDPQKIGFEFYT